MNSLTIPQTIEYLKGRDRYLILTHVRPDGDAHGSAAAFAMLLRKLGKTAYVLANPETTEKFLPLIRPFWAPDGYLPDTVVSVDLASESLFPENASVHLGKTALGIDHHPSNTGYAERTLVDGSLASCGELILELFDASGLEIGREEAEALYIAVSTDTGCFCYSNTSANAFRAAGRFAETGIDISGLNRVLFRTKRRARIALEGMIYAGIEYYSGGKTAVITITKDMMEKSGCTEDDMDDIASIPGGIEGVDCGITLRELTAPDDCKVSVRTAGGISANALCSVLGGGGHAMAAGASPKGMTTEQMKRILLSELEKIREGTVGA